MYYLCLFQVNNSRVEQLQWKPGSPENQKHFFWSWPFTDLVLRYKLFKARDLVCFSFKYLMNELSQVSATWYFYSKFIQPSIITHRIIWPRRSLIFKLSLVRLKPTWKIVSSYAWIKGVVIFSASLVMVSLVCFHGNEATHFDNFQLAIPNRFSKITLQFIKRPIFSPGRVELL